MGQDRKPESDSVLSSCEDNDLQDNDDGVSTESRKNEKRHKCTYSGCSKAFIRPYRLARHIRTHTGERPYICSHDGCDKGYTNSSHLKRHMETHNLTKTTYQCPQCSLTISNRHNLKRHYDRVHGDHNKLTCKDCNLTFTKKHQLMVHLSTHPQTVYTCDKCTKSFTNIKKFNAHKATHGEGKKYYPCTVAECSEVFVKWALLCAHMKTQHVIDYKCSTCGKVFLSKSHLRIHSQIHMENRLVIPCPYEKCPRVYYFQRNLDHHIRTCHLGKKFVCDICDVKISSKRRLAEHIQKLHMSEKRIRVARKLQRAKRKDAGLPKKSMVSTLSGVSLPIRVEKVILERECNIVHSEESNIESTD